ncbi:hypothetical protein [Solibacillus silvestris]|nr:hypothetical protein [Solibacillus silvestris]
MVTLHKRLFNPQYGQITKKRDLLIEESRPIVLLGQPENISG